MTTEHAEEGTTEDTVKTAIRAAAPSAGAQERQERVSVEFDARERYTN